jgi:5-methylcytosine-specific restriction endonuclease McrA
MKMPWEIAEFAGQPKAEAIKPLPRLRRIRIASPESALVPRDHHIGKPCPYCRKTMGRLGKHKATKDHKLPRSRGGQLTAENRIIVCWTCNGDKKDFTLGEWHERLRQGGDPRAPLVWAVLATECR